MELLEQGLSLSAVARKVGCSVSSVSLSHEQYADHAEEGLGAKPVPGRPPNLTTRQKAALVQFVLKRPVTHGYPTDLWTIRRMAEVIALRFGVRYHANHIWRLLVGLG